MRAFSGTSAAVLGLTHMPISTPKCPSRLNKFASCLCSMHTKGMEQLTHGMHCCVRLHDLMGILRILCN